MKLTLGFSPCPNDTFIFDALVNHKIDTKGLEFDVVLEDVQTLNEWALSGKLDITKISYGVLHTIVNTYTMLRSGGALGKGVGPLLVTASAENIHEALQSDQATIVALPGKNTTANFLLAYAYPNLSNKLFMRFDEIEKWTIAHPKSMGVIIHENRFTYQQKGLHCVADLGAVWEQSTGLPIPLGGIAIRKSIDNNIAHLVDSLIRQSLGYAFMHKKNLSQFVKDHAQEMSEAVMQAHIDLYVNEFTADLGQSGEAAVMKMLLASGTGHYTNNVFLQ